jgi:hypothetical protein
MSIIKVRDAATVALNFNLPLFFQIPTSIQAVRCSKYFPAPQNPTYSRTERRLETFSDCSSLHISWTPINNLHPLINNPLLSHLYKMQSKFAPCSMSKW